MLQKLAAQRPSFVKYEKHHGVRLTPAGKMRALEVLRHHRLLERFLHDVLDYTWDEVHEEAERLEHFISEKLEDRMAAKLGRSGDRSARPLDSRREAARCRCAMRCLYRIGLAASRPLSAVFRIATLPRCGKWSAWDCRPGLGIVVEAGVRGASLLVRIGQSPVAPFEPKAGGFGAWVVSAASGRADTES